MFRKSLEMAENPAESIDFLTRVRDLPVVQYIFVQSVDVYGKAKEYNPLVKLTMTAAEKTLTVATERAKPVVAKFRLPLNVANILACKTLDNLEERLPIVTKQPDEIAAQTKKMYEDVIVLPALQRYNNAKQFGMNAAIAIKDYGLQKTNAFLDTKYGHVVVDKLDSLLLVADGFVDKYLPVIVIEEDQPDEPKMTVDLETIVKANLLSAKLRKRILFHGVIKFNASKKRINDILANLHLAVDLLESLKQNVTSEIAKERLVLAGEKLMQLWADFNAGDPRQPGDKTLEQKILYLTHTLSAQLLSAYQKMATAAVLLPAKLKPVMALTQQYVQDLYMKLSKTTSLSDVSSLMIHQAREAITALQTISIQFFDAISSTALSWLAGASQDERKIAMANGSVSHESNMNDLPSDDCPPNQLPDNDYREEDNQDQICFEMKENSRNYAYSQNSNDHSSSHHQNSY